MYDKYGILWGVPPQRYRVTEKGARAPLLFILQFSVFSKTKSLPLGVPPLGECPKDKGGAASGEEKVSPKVTDEGTPLPIDVGLGGAVCLPRIEEMIRTL